MTLDVVIETSISAFSQEDWNRCFPGEAENWTFYKVCEEAGPADFHWFYAAVLRDGRPIALVPAFGTTYRIDTTVQGRWKRLTEQLARIAPALLSVRLLAMGSPVAEVCHLGFCPSVAPAQKAQLLETLVQALMHTGGRQGYRLFGVKDAVQSDEALWRKASARFAMTKLPGLPTAALDLPYADFSEYLASLSKATRKNMQRKRKTFQNVRVEQRYCIDDVEDQVFDLYRQTLNRGAMQFEELPAHYFSSLLHALAPKASIFLYWAEDQLIAFNLVLQEDDRLIDKYIGMHYPLVRRYSLYFNTWLQNVEYCIDRNIKRYQSGQSGYGPKVSLGSRLHPTWQYFRHQNQVANFFLRQVAKIARLDRSDPHISKLIQTPHATSD